MSTQATAELMRVIAACDSATQADRDRAGFLASVFLASPKADTDFGDEALRGIWEQMHTGKPN